MMAEVVSICIQPLNLAGSKRMSIIEDATVKELGVLRSIVSASRQIFLAPTNVTGKTLKDVKEKKTGLYHHSVDSVAFIQQANAAINGAIGTRSKKSRNPRIGFDWTSRTIRKLMFSVIVQLSKPDHPAKLGLC
ncbi:hypothetical protein SASPL_150904 [Salvia splendens]|uniref:Uncharacterized protein n=1 Tax=Salvia splendens TaxID=180675 RepID=A0A8X8W7L6_SALSN|nr:hypothetical protein SASPL_150904 [Salvia splendens]